MRDLWGQAEKDIGVLDRARASGIEVTADIYPDTYWSSNLGVLFPKRNYAGAAETHFVLAHVSLALEILFSRFAAHPDYRQDARRRGESARRQRREDAHGAAGRARRRRRRHRRPGECRTRTLNA
jgi:hypothetical protein